MPKGVRLNSVHFFIMKIPNKKELQQIAVNHSSDIDFKDFMILSRKSVLQNHILFWLMIQLYHQVLFLNLVKIILNKYLIKS